MSAQRFDVKPAEVAALVELGHVVTASYAARVPGVYVDLETPEGEAVGLALGRMRALGRRVDVNGAHGTVVDVQGDTYHVRPDGFAGTELVEWTAFAWLDEPRDFAAVRLHGTLNTEGMTA